MLPIGDKRFEGGPPQIVTVTLIVINVLAFLFEINRPSEAALQSFIQGWGVVPTEYAARHDLAPRIPVPYWTTLITSMFLHGGWAHLFGNMLYLWIFGDNIEKAIGHARFVTFYLITGVAAGLAHIFFNLGSSIPTVGASGAISGVLGGYLVLFPRNEIRILSYGRIFEVPAFYAVGFWILLQFINGVGSIATTEETGGGGVAYLAHIGGFVAGVVLIKLFAVGTPLRR